MGVSCEVKLVPFLIECCFYLKVQLIDKLVNQTSLFGRHFLSSERKVPVPSKKTAVCLVIIKFELSSPN